MSRVVLIGADSQLEHQARVLLGDEVISLAPDSTDGIVSRVVRLDRRPELVVLGSNMPTHTAIGLAHAVEQLSDVRALVTLVPEVRMLARDEGIAEFLAPDAELEDVDALFGRARLIAERVRATMPGRRETARGRGWATVVVSPKGGVGKTTIATNVAVALAAENPGQKIVLVDLDLQFGDAATMLGITPRHTVVDAMGKAAARDGFLLRGFLSEHPSGVAVLCAPESPAAADSLPADRVGHLLRQFAVDFDHVVVDTAPGLGDHTLAAIEQASSLVTVGELDLSSLRGIRKELDVLAELELLPSSRYLLLNGVERGVGITIADAERVLDVPVDFAVPRRRALQLAGNHGVPVVTGARRDSGARVLRRLARRLAQDQKAENVSRRGRRGADHKEKLS